MESIKLKSVETSQQFQKLVKTLKLVYFHKDATERTIRDSLMTLNDYLEIFHRQLVSKLKSDKEINERLSITEFLPDLNDDLLVFCTSYFDSVRDEASRAMLFIGKNFCKFDTPISKENQDRIQVLRANMALQGWNDMMTGPIKECAEVESDVAKWMFKEPAEFIDKIITVMLDEPTTRDHLGKYTMVLTKSLPFMMMNDYRIALG